MRSTLRYLLVLSCLAVGSTGCDFEDGSDPNDPPDAGDMPDGGVPSGDSAFARNMLAEHNKVRATAVPMPSPALPALTWSDTAAATAQAWADKCNPTHNPNRGNLGENIAYATPSVWNEIGVVRAWAAEAADYDYARNTCAPGKDCGHYTQLVWRNTTQLGCGMKECDRNSPFQGFTRWQFWVCNYAPPGNVIGQKPY